MTTDRTEQERAAVAAWLQRISPRYEAKYGICLDKLILRLASAIERGFVMILLPIALLKRGHRHD